MTYCKYCGADLPPNKEVRDITDKIYVITYEDSYSILKLYMDCGYFTCKELAEREVKKLEIKHPDLDFTIYELKLGG